MNSIHKLKVVTIVGPTASGKTSLSIEIAKHFNGEVISADSRQVYRDMDLGTGKVTKEEMQGVPHHLLDVADPSEVYTGSDFVRDAAAAIASICGRGRLPIIAGGTFFYIDLLRGKMQAAPVEPNQKLRATLEQRTDEELFAELQEKDPQRAKTIDQENRRRLIRALEIIDALGTVPPPTPAQSPYDMLLIGVDITTEQLHDNIYKRLLERIDEGMIEEVKRLRESGVSCQRLDELGLEYRYIAKHLQGELTKDEMLDTLNTKIRQYAKRQMTWLKRDPKIEWFSPRDVKGVARRVKQFLGEA